MRFVPHTPDDIREMLAAAGISSVDELFADIPEQLRATAAVNLPPGLTEQEVVGCLEALNARNDAAGLPSFLGAGAYPHFVPAVVDHIIQRAEFYSAYTPYQPEVSQGTLQAIFEFQTLIAMLFDLEVANASMYDGASATAEAVLMALRAQRKRTRVILARSLHPEYRQVTMTYLRGLGDDDVIEAPFGVDGRVDLAWLADHVNRETAAVVVGYPNFFGVIEDLLHIADVIRDSGAMLVTATAEPLALALIKPPGTLGAEIAVGEGQSCGETTDDGGRRGYVLTLATREQHIRRERATSNICTNH